MESRLRQNDAFPSKSFLETIEWEKESEENFMTLFEKLLGHTLITADNIWGLMGVMCIGVALSIFLEQKYQWASKVSGAIIALIMAMVLANLGVIPTNSALYDDIVWGVIVPMAIPLLLLQCNLSRVWKDTGRMLVVFLIGWQSARLSALLSHIMSCAVRSATHRVLQRSLP